MVRSVVLMISHWSSGMTMTGHTSIVSPARIAHRANTPRPFCGTVFMYTLSDAYSLPPGTVAATTLMPATAPSSAAALLAAISVLGVALSAPTAEKKKMREKREKRRGVQIR